MPEAVEQLPGNRVRLKVDVSPDQVEHAYEHAAADLAESVKIPGFRPGRVPLDVLIARVGKDRVWAEAVDSHIGGWFWSAAARARLRPVTSPEYTYELPSSKEDPWAFTATVEVQPTPEIVDWTTLEVGRPEPEVPEELIDGELQVLRETVAELVPVDGRPAQQGDTVVVDVVSGGEAQSGTVVELGAGTLSPEIEEALAGASVGETRTLDLGLPDGSVTAVELTLRHVNEKILPEVDDDLARAASEFDTLAELRAEIEERLREQIDAEIEVAFRARAIDELVRASGVEAAGPLVDARARQLADGFVRSLAQRGISPEAYFAAAGVAADEVAARLRAEAAQSVARELVLEAVAEQAGIAIGDDDVKELIREEAALTGDDPDQVIEEMWAHGHQETLREDLRMRAALDLVASQVRRIAPELADAREKLWTPDKERPAGEAKLWTPGSSKESQ